MRPLQLLALVTALTACSVRGTAAGSHAREGSASAAMKAPPASDNGVTVTEAEPATRRPPVIGGSCAYGQKEVTGTVVAIEGQDVALVEEDGTTFFGYLSVFGAPPLPGDRYRFTKRFITQGTCTPLSYTLIGPVAP